MKKAFRFINLFLLTAILSNCKTTNSTISSVNNETAYVKEDAVQEIEYIEENSIRYEDKTYREKIETVQLYKAGDQLSIPVLYLNTNEQLELHFDDLTADYKTYSYSIIHCNADWQPSGLVVTEYMTDFFSGYIEDYEYSFNTLFRYLHYKVNIPNNDVRFKLSGNYIIKVFANNDEDDLVLTKRFFVVERKVQINATVKMATLARYREYKHEVDFTIDHSNYIIQDPYADLKVVISQNRRWDNAITDLKPLFVRTPELIYNYEDKNLFDGNNEYRFFDAKDLRYQSLNVDGIQIMENKTHLFVLPEEPRSSKRYYNQADINGKRLINRLNSPNFNREADYMITHFTLKRENPLPNGDIYVFGELSDWQFKEEFKMDYIGINSQYELKTLLKQGYYNYNYVFLPKGKTVGDMSMIEGTHSETFNEYYIFVYNRQRGEIYDRLIGFDIRESNKN